MVILECTQCHKSFEVTNSRKKTARFCSHSCAAKVTKNRQGHIKPLINNLCKMCDKEFKSKYHPRLFCSRLCSIRYGGIMGKNSPHTTRGKTWEEMSPTRYHERKTGKKIVCSWCNEEFYRKKSHVERDSKFVFCSNKCRIEWMKINGSWPKGLTCSTDDRVRRNHEEIHKILWRRPTMPEKILDMYLQDNFPGTWRYVGDGSFTVGGYNPDFINAEGKKQIIEMFGDYWHRDQDPQDRINLFKNYGYDCIIIWEKEVKALIESKDLWDPQEIFI